MSLNIVEGRNEVESVCPRLDRKNLWLGFGDLPSATHGLAPIYFHGTCVLDYCPALTHSYPFSTAGPGPDKAFVNGVVYLDSGHTGLYPPQVKYTLAITGADIRVDPRRLIFQGVEPWGPRSGAGVFGVSVAKQSPSHRH